MLKVCTVYRAASIRLNALPVNLILKPISPLFIQSSSHSLHFCLCISRLYFSSFLKASRLALPETHGISALLSCQAPFVSLRGHRFLPFHTPSLQSHGIAIYSHSLSLSLSLTLSLSPPSGSLFLFSSTSSPSHPPHYRSNSVSSSAGLQQCARLLRTHERDCEWMDAI